VLAVKVEELLEALEIAEERFVRALDQDAVREQLVFDRANTGAFGEISSETIERLATRTR
jgi:hypothetical protein